MLLQEQSAQIFSLQMIFLSKLFGAHIKTVYLTTIMYQNLFNTTFNRAFPNMVCIYDEQKIPKNADWPLT